MASTDSRPIPIKNTAYRAVFPILDADGDLVTGATGLDSEVSKDQGTFADCTNEATEIATASGMYYLDLTSTEMNADCVAVIVKTSSSGAKTTVLVFYPEETGDINVDVTAFGGTAATTSGGRPEVNTTHAAGTAWNSGAIGATTLAADTLTAAKMAADVGTEIAAAVWDRLTSALSTASSIGKLLVDNVNATISSRASQTSVDAVDDFVDTEVAAILAAVDTEVGAIKAKTDNLPAAPAATSDIPTAAAVADAVWDEALAGHAGAGSAGEALSAAGTAGDPWTTSLPGAYGAGTAGKILGDNLNATVSSRASQTSVDTVDDFLDTEIAAIKAKTDNLPASPAATSDIPSAATIAAAVWDYLTSAATTVGSLGKLIVDNLNATVSSRLASASYTAPLDAAGTRAAVGLASANLDTQLAAIDDYIDTEIAAILVDTGTTLDDLVDDLETRLTAALATKLAQHAAGVLAVVIGTGSTTTAVVLSTVEGAAPSATDDFYNGAVLIFTSGALAGQRTDITDYTGGTVTATVTALTGAPANGVTALIV